MPLNDRYSLYFALVHSGPRLCFPGCVGPLWVPRFPLGRPVFVVLLCVCVCVGVGALWFPVGRAPVGAGTGAGPREVFGWYFLLTPIAKYK